MSPRARWYVIGLSTVAVLSSAGSSAVAQDAPPPAAPPADFAPPPPAPPPPAPAPGPIPSAAPLKVEGKNGSLRVGFLLQPQYQAVSSANTALSGYTQNLYIRRARILVGGSLFGAFDYFFDTDYPNLFLNNGTEIVVNNMTMMATQNTGLKNTPGMNIQDAFVTWKAMGDLFKVDVGYMLPPMSHNAIQGATTLYSWDYFTYTFQHNNVFGTSASPVGRDAGLQLRGLVLDGHLEYRAGLFQGLRDQASATEVAAHNFFRFTARVQANLLDAETGFFYQGTYLGAKRILSVGASVDVQDSYKSESGDVFLDMPLGPGILTGQVDVSHWNGNGFVALNRQTAAMGEAGFIFLPVGISPIVRYEHLWIDGDPNQVRYAGGIAFWPFGHNSNLKAFYTRFQEQNAARGVNQINVQWQLFFF
jgi:hypothetical protein